MQWYWHRSEWVSAKAAVEDAHRFDSCLGGLASHPTVVFALAQIDAAERTIESVANEMLCEHHDARDEED